MTCVREVVQVCLFCDQQYRVGRVSILGFDEISLDTLDIYLNSLESLLPPFQSLERGFFLLAATLRNWVVVDWATTLVRRARQGVSR